MITLKFSASLVTSEKSAVSLELSFIHTGRRSVIIVLLIEPKSGRLLSQNSFSELFSVPAALYPSRKRERGRKGERVGGRKVERKEGKKTL